MILPVRVVVCAGLSLAALSAPCDLTLSVISGSSFSLQLILKVLVVKVTDHTDYI